MSSLLRMGLVLLAGLAVSITGCGRERSEAASSSSSDGGGEGELDGTWFVRYRSVRTPFLDVSFSGGGQPTEVRVDLQGPEERFEGLELAWNQEDSEWQHPIEWLPDPLPEGLWWVAAVEARLPSGAVLSYSSAHPSQSYTVVRRDSRTTQPSPPSSTQFLPGAFTAPPTAGSVLRIETSPVAGQPTADPILHAFEVGESSAWFAVNDDFEVDSTYPSLWIDPGERSELWIRLSGQEDDQGAYQLQVQRGAQSGQPRVEGSPAEDQFEVGDAPGTARVIRPGEARIRRLSGQADEDWFRIVLLPE